MWNRRQVLGGVGSLALVSASSFPVMANEAVNRIDIHTHFVPKAYRDGLMKANLTAIGRVPFPNWTENGMIAFLDQQKIKKAILSISAPGVYFGDLPLARHLAIATNDEILALKERHPGRVGGFATLPLPDIDASLREIERISAAGFEGVILLTNYEGVYLGDPKFDPVMEELNKRRVPVFIHPTLPPGDEIDLTLPPPVLEFVFETTRTMAHMIFSGAIDRYPNIPFIVGHLGGTLPYVSWRLRIAETSPRDVYAKFRERGRTIADYLQGFYYDTALSAAPASLSSLLEIVGSDRILFGTDFPFAPPEFITETTSNLEKFKAFSSADLDAITHGNAERLFQYKP